MPIRLARLSAASLITAALTSGCTAIDFSVVTPPAVTLAGNCTQATNGGAKPFLMPSLAASTDDYVASTSLGELKSRIAAIQQTLPPNLREDPVVKGFSAVIVKAAIQGQIAGLKAANFSVSDEEEVKKIPVPSRLTHGQLKHFVLTLLSDKTPAVVDLKSSHITMPATQGGATIGDYLAAYYQGDYRDIYGTKLDKPTVNMTISDKEIAAVLTVFLDYIADSLNLVPVLTSDKSPKDGETTFYIGGNKTMPTALKLKIAKAEFIPETSNECEWTKENAFLLETFANASGDEAATVSALSSQSAGGFEIGLGFLGKISVGDNQALSTIVKTAASQTANRAALSALFWAVERRHRAVAFE